MFKSRTIHFNNTYIPLQVLLQAPGRILCYPKAGRGTQTSFFLVFTVYFRHSILVRIFFYHSSIFLSDEVFFFLEERQSGRVKLLESGPLKLQAKVRILTAGKIVGEKTTSFRNGRKVVCLKKLMEIA